MTAQTRPALQAVFESGDTPQGSDFANLIDSYVSLTDSSAQTITSKVTISGGLETAAVSCNSLNVAQSVSASSMSIQVVSANRIHVFETVSASACWLGPTKTATLAVGTAAPAAGQGVHFSVSGDSNFRIDIASTVVANTGASGPATPASVAGYIPIMINGVLKKIAFYEI